MCAMFMRRYVVRVVFSEGVPDSQALSSLYYIKYVSNICLYSCRHFDENISSQGAFSNPDACAQGEIKWA